MHQTAVNVVQFPGFSTYARKSFNWGGALTATGAHSRRLLALAVWPRGIAGYLRKLEMSVYRDEECTSLVEQCEWSDRVT